MQVGYLLHLYFTNKRIEPEKQPGVEGREAARADAGNDSQGSTVA